MMKETHLLFLLLTSSIPTNYGFILSRTLSKTNFLPSYEYERNSKVTDFGSTNKSHLWKSSCLTLHHDNEEIKKEDGEVVLATKQLKKETTGMKTNKCLSSNKKTLKNLALSLLLMICFTFAPLVHQSLAIESGGRMGGSYSRQRSSPPASSRMYSSPSRSYSRSNSYYRPNVVTPYYSPSPFFNPFGGPRLGYGGGVTVVSRGPSFFDVIVLAGTAFTLFSVFSKSSSSSDRTSTSSSSALGPGFSVLQLSVALNVPKRDSSSSILSKLDYLAETARTDSRLGLQNLVSEVSLELLRQRQSIVSASSSYSHYDDYNQAQRDFNNLSIRERSKFQRETVSKYKGVDYSERSLDALPLPSSQLPQATVAVITLVLYIEGDSTRIPSAIRSTSDLQKALSLISSDALVDSCLQGAEILWTPQDRMETLSMQDVVADYPNLRTI